MPVDNRIEVAGIKDALRELNQIDKRLRRQITGDFQEIVRPVVQDAQSLVPTTAPLSGMERNWSPRDGQGDLVLPYTGAGRRPKLPPRWAQSKEGRRQHSKWLRWKYGIRGYVSGKKPMEFNGYIRNLATFGVRFQGAASVLFDTASKSKTPQGARLVSALNSRYGRPSRVMWRAYESSEDQVQRNMVKLVNKIMESVDRKTRI